MNPPESSNLKIINMDFKNFLPCQDHHKESSENGECEKPDKDVDAGLVDAGMIVSGIVATRHRLEGNADAGLFRLLEADVRYDAPQVLVQGLGSEVQRLIVQVKV
jgi:hypothetical protein